MWDRRDGRSVDGGGVGGDGCGSSDEDGRGSAGDERSAAREGLTKTKTNQSNPGCFCPYIGRTL